MKTLSNTFRRRFLRTASMASLAIGFLTAGGASAFSMDGVAENAGGQQTISQIQVSYRTSLYQTPKSIVLPIGGWSELIATNNHQAYKVKVIPVTYAVKPGIGPVFAVILADAMGKEVARINLGDGATGTFMDFGIQRNILSMPSPTS